MTPVPTGCRERAAFIRDRADQLEHAFRTGNKGYVRAELLDLPPGVALAVTAHIAVRCPGICSYLLEAA